MAAAKRNTNSDAAVQRGGRADRLVYQEFGSDPSPALERGQPDLTPAQQTLTIQASRKGRKGKTVTIISGFQVKSETLSDLLKQLKGKCGAGGTVKEDKILEIQGDHRSTLKPALESLGYKVKLSGG